MLPFSHLEIGVKTAHLSGFARGLMGCRILGACYSLKKKKKKVSVVMCNGAHSSHMMLSSLVPLVAVVEA